MAFTADGAGIMSVPGITLSRHIIEEEHRFPSATGEFSILLQQISYAGRVLAHTIGRAAIDGIAGSTGTVGPTGDVQKRLDMLADEIMRDAFTRSKLVAGIASEEHEDPAELNVSSDANYLLCLDPLDGSGNTGNNAPMGTIFGIFRRGNSAGPVVESDFLRPGRELVAAGYLLYGPSTMLVYTVGEGVHGFTLDRNVGEFLLTNPNISCTTTGRVVAVNTGRTSEWPEGARDFVEQLSSSRDGHMIRYSGAPVADIHRCLIEGGAFLYPPDADYPNGKLSTLYEAAPLAFIAEQAGGAASDGSTRVLDIVPTSLHSGTPAIIGSKDLVEKYERSVRMAP
jgi:fructose-1,6-bisphosphatase I